MQRPTPTPQPMISDVAGGPADCDVVRASLGSRPWSRDSRGLSRVRSRLSAFFLGRILTQLDKL